MNRRFIVSLLILLLVTPLNAVASMPMAHGQSADTGMHVAHMQSSESIPAHEVDHGHDHDHDPDHDTTETQPAYQQSMMDRHDHDAEDCDEYCMDCSNHCSGNAILTSYKDYFGLAPEFEKLTAINTVNRSYLLFRPPILSWGS